MARNKYDIDETLDTPFNWTQMKRIMQYVKPYSKKIWLAVVIMFIASAISLLAPMLLMVVINSYIPDKNVNGILTMAALLTVIYIVNSVFIGIKAILVNKVGQGIIHDIRLDMFKHLQELPFSYFDDRPHGKILVRIVNYVNSISDILSNGVINVVVELLSLVVIVVYMLIISPQLTVYALAGIPVLLLGISAQKGFQRRANQLYSAKTSNLNAYTQESLSGMKVTQAFVRENENRKILHKLSSDFRFSWMYSVMVAVAGWPLIETVTNGTVALIYAAGAIWVYSSSGGMLEVGVLVAFVGYVWRFWVPIATFSNFYTQILSAAAYIERIFEFLDEPVKIGDNEDSVLMPEIKGHIEFKNVNFAYDPATPVLENISFVANRGDSIALVGPTGGGKSTIVNLISRFYDIQSGSVSIDNYDVRSVIIDSLRKQMGIMLQDPYLFPGTIMENIRYGKLDATDEECIAAAKAVCAHEFIMKLPDGYKTVINEQGSGVSAGEKQLISFARVMLSDPRILIMDEATASIDTRTERALQQGLEKLLTGRTSFIIAHRLSTIRTVTKIMYIADKSIIESGTHDELIAAEGKYYELYQSQFNALA